MKLNVRVSAALCLAIAALVGLFAPVPTAFAQGVEAEPNHPCTSAQDFGSAAIPFTVNGSLDSTPESPDVDFYRFTAVPGTSLTVTLRGAVSGHGTLVDSYLGFFDSACNLLAANDDYQGPESRLVITVPADGTFVLGATAFPDTTFIGGGIGTYEVGLEPFATIRSIGGRLVDAVSKLPIDGSKDPFLSVQLYGCSDTGTDCTNILNSSSTGPDGRFLFATDFSGQPLEVGTYKIEASASEYHPAETEPLLVGAGEAKDIGDLALEPFPVRISEIRPCGALPPEGGTCRYSIRITNRLATDIDGAAWSLVNGDGIGSLTGSTNFQAGSPRGLTLAPGTFKIVHFSFNVPSTVADGANICAQAVVGEDRAHPYFNTVGQKSLFCIQKGFTGNFTVLSGKDAAKVLRKMNGHLAAPKRQ
jgi:hypothetical protein